MSTEKLQAFYKSRTWERFVQGLRSERAQSDGTVLCEHCGKPIVKAYDCIGHHVQELTDDNVDNAQIALNPENVILVHLRCHNEIHKRFGHEVREPQRVYIVWGAPCSGKRSWVDSVAEQGDLVLDIDALWTAVQRTANAGDKPNALKQNVFALRDCLIDQIRTRRGRWNNAYIIGGYPLQGERERLAVDVGADRLIFIDTPETECLRRASNVGVLQFGFVQDWFEKFSNSPPGQS